MSAPPYTIRQILQQIGQGPHGGLCYVGASQASYRHPEEGWECERRPSFDSVVTKTGQVDYEIGVSFRVNGKPKENWMMFVTYEANDTYTVRLWSKSGILDSRERVYCDGLQQAVEMMYDKAIKNYGGFTSCPH